MAPLVAALFSKGLSMLGDAVLAKGKDFVEDKLGVKLEDSVRTEAGLLELKRLEMQHEEFLLNAAIKRKEQELEEQKIDNSNTSDARNQNVRIQESEHASPLAKNAAYVLDFVIVGSTFFMVILLFATAVPDANKEFFYMALGSLLTMCGTVVNFHRGSSARSASKDATIHALSNGGVR